MKRREFLAASGASLLLAPFARAAGAEPPRRDIKKAVKLGMVAGDLSLEEKFRLLKELGFDGVEIDSPSDLDLDEVAAARDKSGLAVPGVVDSAHWRRPFSDPDAGVRAEGCAALETALRAAERVGASTVLVVPAVVSAAVPYDAAYTRSQAEIRQLLPLAQELGVKIAFENVWNHFLLSPLEAARYVDEFESDCVGWYFDVGNVVNTGWPEQWIRILGRRILKLDVKEFSRKKRDDEGLWRGFDVEIGEGDCGWPAVMAALDEIGFQGWATAEVGGGNRARLEDIAARMDRVLAL